jgi:hypothetical protein
MDDIDAQIERSASVKLSPQNHFLPSKNVSIKPNASKMFFLFSSAIFFSPKYKAGYFKERREGKEIVNK